VLFFVYFVYFKYLGRDDMGIQRGNGAREMGKREKVLGKGDRNSEV
jgi:hypothetical protein